MKGEGKMLELIFTMVLGGIFMVVWYIIMKVYYEIMEDNKRQREISEQISMTPLL